MDETSLAHTLNPMTPRPFRIERMRKETSDTFTLDLVAAGSAAPFTFAPGQFNMIYVFGVGEVPISISGDPCNKETLIHTIRAVGTVTSAMRACKRGDVLGVRGPFGTSWPIEKAQGQDVVIAAGGLGLAPLRSVIYELVSGRGKYGAVTVLYGSRSPQDLLFRRELEQWRGRFDLDVQVTVDHAESDWRGNVGWISTLIPAGRFDAARTAAFVCGPEVMMRTTARDLMRRGVSDESIYVSMERNMKCAVGFCGHCMFGPTFICKDGPIFSYNRVKELMLIREL
ncbi:MAG TPA: FAD/NAD(P)-binding protein [Planctomycetota bacterium]|nr:FAD/NAD(P)-binding protein [Planctomycetota bacterium]